jgi:hypothetical protein
MLGDSLHRQFRHQKSGGPVGGGALITIACAAKSQALNDLSPKTKPGWRFSPENHLGFFKNMLAAGSPAAVIALLNH